VASHIAALRYVRHGLIALSIPATLLTGTVLPASFHSAQTTGIRHTNAQAFIAMPAEQAAWGEATNTPSYQGEIVLGTPAAIDEQAPRIATPSPDAADIALEHVGARYRYGGASPRGFDCSGLTMYVYSQLGVVLPHRASAQFNEDFGQRIESIEALAPGDLVFFHRTTRARGITHVALYVGDGMMVSANSPRTGVQHVSMYGSYWKTRFVGGLRPYR
jgi:cell wall-associated NlpC family hydrolase